MRFNHGLERKKFDAAWKKLRKEYAANGMSGAAIAEIYRFDLETFNSNRRYAEHTQEMPSQIFDDGDAADDGNSALLMKFFDSFSVMPRETDESNRYGWLDEIENPEAVKALRQLSPEDIELLTLYVFDGYGVMEIAEMQGVKHPTISKKLKRIKKYLLNSCGMATKSPSSPATP